MAGLRPIPNLDSRLKLKQLRLLVAIGDSGSIGRAAARLNVAQPAITRALRELENALGVRLFDRGRLGATPTAYGLALLRRARGIVAEVRRTGDEIAELSHGNAGEVAVGTLISASAELLPRALARLRRERPRVAVRIADGTNDVLMPALRAGELDLVVGRLPEFRERDGIAQERLYVEPACVVAAPGHPLARRRRVGLAEIARAAWLLPPPETNLRRRLEAAFRAAKLEPPHGAIESVSPLANQVLLSETDLLGVIPHALAQRWRAQGAVAILPVRIAGLAGTVGICTAAGRPPSPAAQCLAELLRRVAAEIAPRGGEPRVP